jgi:hypothetical protein
MPGQPAQRGEENLQEVAKVLQELKAEVRRQHALSSPADAPGLDAPAWSATLEQVRASARVNPHLPIAWPEWPPGVWPKVEALAQKIVRRLLRWYINPIVEQQNRFNASVAWNLEAAWHQITDLEQELARRDRQGMEDGQ